MELWQRWLARGMMLQQQRYLLNVLFRFWLGGQFAEWSELLFVCAIHCLYSLIVILKK